MSNDPQHGADPLDRRPDFNEDDPNAVFTLNRWQSARNALRFYRIMAIITGVMLLILTIEMIFKYLIWGLMMGGNPAEALTFGSFNAAAAVAIAHGWCYVAYLIVCFWLNSQMKWGLKNLLVLALAGVVPVMSFIVEAKIHRRGEKELDDAVVVAPKSAA